MVLSVLLAGLNLASAPLQAGTAPVVRLDLALDAILPADSKVDKISGGFGFTEGPVWDKKGGYLLFSDIPGNTIFKLKPGQPAEPFRKSSGYQGEDLPKGAFWGSNGLVFDKQGRLTICEHGNRRVTRIEKDGTLTVLADKFDGKRLNSPNDAVYRANGDLYFTDPPYGPVQGDQDPKKEVKFNGVYRVTPAGKVDALVTDLERPNGIAFSPDQKVLYVANSFATRRIWMNYPVNRDGTLGKGSVFFDATALGGSGVPDGMRVDKKGNLFCTGPGGVLIFSAAGKHLGTIPVAEGPANVAWGDSDGRSLYITARTGVYRIRVSVGGW